MLVSQGKNLKMPRHVTHIQIYVLCLVILSSYLHQSLPSWFFHSGFGNKCLSTFIFSCVSHASTQFILLNFIIPVIQSFNPALEESRPKRGSYTLWEWSFINETGRSHVHVEKGLQKFLYINIVGTPDALSLTPTCSAMKTPQHRIWNWWPWTNRWGTYPNRILLWLIVPPKYKSSNRKLHVRT